MWIERQPKSDDLKLYHISVVQFLAKDFMFLCSNQAYLRFFIRPILQHERINELHMYA